jgi:hypothetical protein
MTDQPEALMLANILQHRIPSIECLERAAAELRRLHEVNAELLAALKSLIDTRHKHFINNEIDGMHGWDEKALAAIAKAEGKP